MKKKEAGGIFLKGIRFSLGLKLIIIVWSFCVAVFSDERTVSITYLVVAIVFVGFFIFQLQYYRNKKSEKDDTEGKEMKR